MHYFTGREQVEEKETSFIGANEMEQKEESSKKILDQLALPKPPPPGMFGLQETRKKGVFETPWRKRMHRLVTFGEDENAFSTLADIFHHGQFWCIAKVVAVHSRSAKNTNKTHDEVISRNRGSFLFATTRNQFWRQFNRKQWSPTHKVVLLAAVAVVHDSQQYFGPSIFLHRVLTKDQLCWVFTSMYHDVILCSFPNYPPH